MLKRLLADLRGHRPAAKPAPTPVVTPAPAAPAASPAPPPSPWSYQADGFATSHNADFLADPRFRESYALGAASGHRISSASDLHIEWRVLVCCWAASHGLRLQGDFVECGVSTGIVSRAVAHFVDFAAHPERTLWLFDTFGGIPEGQARPEEAALARSKNARHYFDSYDLVRGHFAAYPNVRLVRGAVPESLAQAPVEQVAWLHIDMNIAYPEVAASEWFWDRLAPGAVVVYDDYASRAHVPQKQALDAFAAARGVRILPLPTGQGLLIKS